MGALTETEIFDCLETNLRAAAQHADDLAATPRFGGAYIKLREELMLIEGACRQASVWREDARWLPVGMMMHETHQRAGDWLRSKQPKKLFSRLAENIRAFLVVVQNLRHKRTGRSGMIVPKPAHVVRTEGRAVQVPGGYDMRPSGLIVPAA